MLPFRLSMEARSFFKHLRDSGVFKTEFDSFYFCFVTGVANRIKVTLAANETAELVNYFPDRYRNRGKLLVALFLKTELELMGISLDDRNIVRREISRLVATDSPSYLSEEGVREFNNFAHGGFEYINEWFTDKPRTLDTFLSTFKQHFDKSFSN